MRGASLLMCLLLTVGCGTTQEEFDEGVEEVVVTADPGQVEKAKLLGSSDVNERSMLGVHSYAKEFAYKAGGNVAFIEVQPRNVSDDGAYYTAYIGTVSAYKRRPVLNLMGIE
jgi:hypothetical protein